MRIATCLLAGMALLAALIARASDPAASDSPPMKPALLVIDIQNEFLPYMAEEDKKFALEMINGAIWLFRQHGFPVIRVYHTDPEWGPKPDSEGFEFPETINILPDDPKIIKNFPSAFTRTELEKVLRDRECNTLFLCGLSATGCVLATYYGAVDREFNTFMIKGALISHDASYTRMIEDISDAVSLKTMRMILDLAKKP